MVSPSEGPRKPRSAEFAEPIRRIDPAAFPLTDEDRYELIEKRGLTDETIAAANLGSVRNQDDLETLCLDWPFDGLPSTILIPYGPPDEHGRYLFRLHKRSLPNTT